MCNQEDFSNLSCQKKKEEGKKEIWEGRLPGELIEKSLKYSLLHSVLQTLSPAERKDTLTVWAELIYPVQELLN